MCTYWIRYSFRSLEATAIGHIVDAQPRLLHKQRIKLACIIHLHKNPHLCKVDTVIQCFGWLSVAIYLSLHHESSRHGTDYTILSHQLFKGEHGASLININYLRVVRWKTKYTVYNTVCSFNAWCVLITQELAFTQMNLAALVSGNVRMHSMQRRVLRRTWASARRRAGCHAISFPGQYSGILIPRMPAPRHACPPVQWRH